VTDDESRGGGSRRPTGAEAGDWPDHDLVAHRAAATPDATAVVAPDRGREWDYAALDTIVGDVGARLAADLPDRGGRVGTLLAPRFATAVVLHATWRAGGAAVPLDTSLSADAVADRLERADVDVVVCGAETEDVAAAAAAEVACRGGDSDRDGGCKLPVRSVDAPTREAVAGLQPGDAVRSTSPAPVTRADVVLLPFPSGTTGEPSGVRLTAGTLVAGATASAHRLGTLPEDRWLAPLPMYHLGGLAPVYRTALYGTTLVVQREFDADGTAAAVAANDVTGLSLVPTQLRRLLEAGWSPPATLRCVLLGGAPASADLVADALAADVPVHPTYGSTETASQIATARPGEAHERPGTVGQPLQFTAVTVVDDEGRTLSAGERGELVVDGPTVTPGYLDAGETEAAFGDYGFHTGDLGYRDADGYCFVVGRLEDTIVTGGENVHPGSAADALRDHPAVRDAAVVGLPDEEWGERVAALVVPEDRHCDGERETGDGSETVSALRDHCRERLPAAAVPRSIGMAEALPRTPSGTVDREAVRERLDGA
jgi:O-succinylbenzoic acid--CoA ligase